MLTIWAMRDTDIQDLPELGLLRSTFQKPNLAKTQKILLRKKIEDGRFGPFNKDIPLPLYTKSTLRHLTEIQSNFNTSSSNCIGLLFPHPIPRQPLGYVSIHESVYHLSLPVYNKSLFSPFFFRIVGYLPTNDCYVAVVRRRVLFWILLAAAVCCAFTIVYLSFAYGFFNAMQQLLNFF